MQLCIYYSTHLLYTGSVFEEDEAETSWTAGILVNLDGAVRHFSEFIEVVLQILLTRVPAKAADKHFPEGKIRTGRGNVWTLKVRMVTERFYDANEWKGGGGRVNVHAVPGHMFAPGRWAVGCSQHEAQRFRIGR